MSRLLIYLIGPELFWALVCFGLYKLGRPHSLPDEKFAYAFDGYWGWLAFVMPPLTFALFWLPGASGWWYLLRVDLAIAVGLFGAATIYANTLMYHSPSSGPGAGTAFIIIPIFGYVTAAIPTLIAAVIIWMRHRAKT
jgi:hypothetical protein